MTIPGRIGTASIFALSLLLAQGGQLSPAVGETAAAAPDRAACDRAKFKVVIDVGHTSESPGAESARGVDEFDFNMKLSKQIESKLIDAGFEKTYLMVTEGATVKSLHKRIATANGRAPDLFVSIHHDSTPDQFKEKWEFNGKERKYSDRFTGHSIFISHDHRDPKTSLMFAKLLGTQLKARSLKYTPHYTEKFMGNKRRELVDSEAGVYRYDQLMVLRKTNMPAVLLEAGIIVNRADEEILATPERQTLIGAAMVDAVDQFCSARPPKETAQAAEKSGKPANAKPARASRSSHQRHAVRPVRAAQQPDRAKGE